VASEVNPINAQGPEVAVRSTLLVNFAHRGLQLSLLAVAMAAGGYARTALSPLQETMRIALSLSDNQIAFVQGVAVGVPVAVFAIPLGLLIDRCSRVRLLLVLVVLSLIGTLFTALASSFTVLLLTRALAGVSGLGTVPVVLSLLGDLYTPGQRGRATTAVCIGQVGGVSAAFALGGVLMAASASRGDSWQWSMRWLSVPLIPAAALMLALREPPRTGLTLMNPTIREVWHELQHYRSALGPLAVGIISAEAVLGAILVWAAPTLSRDFGVAPDRVGTIMGMGALASGLVGPAIGGILADLCQRTGGPHRTIAVVSGLTLLGAPVGLFAFVPHVAIASALLIIAMTLMLAVNVMGVTLFTIVLPNELRGLCTSALMAANLLSSVAVAPLIVSLLTGAIGGADMVGKALSIVCVTNSILAAAAFAYSRVRLKAI
jgi:MFS family permease